MTASRLLIVEPDERTRQDRVLELRTRGWDVRDAEGITTAIDELIEYQPHVVVTALRLPNTHAFHFVRTFRSVVDHDIVVVGVAVDEATAAEVPTTEFDLLLVTPLDYERLESALALHRPADRDDTRATTKLPRLKR